MSVFGFTEADVHPETDRTRYNVQYRMTLRYAASGESPRRVECYASNALWDFTGLDRNDCRLQRWEDTDPLQDPGCAPGGTTPGSLGILRAFERVCE
jgi:hypothetical protein